MQRRQGPRPVSFALDRLADQLEPPTPLAAIQRVWPKVAGSYANVSEPVAERDGVVVIAKVNEALGRPAVKRLRPRATRT